MNREDLLLTDEELDNIGYPILPLGDRSGYKRVAQAQSPRRSRRAGKKPLRAPHHNVVH